MLAKLQIKGTGNTSNQDNHGSSRQNGANYDGSPVRNEMKNEPNSPSDLKKTPDVCLVNSDCKRGRPQKRNVSFPPKGGNSNGCGPELLNVHEVNECSECFGLSKTGHMLERLGSHVKATKTEPEPPNLIDVQVEDEVQRQGKQSPSSGDCNGSRGSSSSKGNYDSNSVVDCEIHWDNLHIGEEIGQGKFNYCSLYLNFDSISSY